MIFLLAKDNMLTKYNIYLN